MAYSNTSKKPFAAWNWSIFSKTCKAAVSMANFLSAVHKDYRAIRKLSRMTHRELADIGLIRSDLSRDGLVAAGQKRARKQQAVADEIAKRPQ